MKKVQLAAYKGKGLIGNALIRAWTRSKYSHCEVVVDGVCYSSSLMDKGVRSKVIDLNDGKWDLIDMPFVDGDKVIEYFKATDDQKYNLWGLVTSQLLNRVQTIKGVQFCSEWFANAIELPNAPSYNPAMIVDMVIFLNKFYAKAK